LSWYALAGIFFPQPCRPFTAFSPLKYPLFYSFFAYLRGELCLDRFVHLILAFLRLLSLSFPVFRSLFSRFSALDLRALDVFSRLPFRLFGSRAAFTFT